jgi:23S rRNA pseudouridine1911/1915/1917 synthase
MKRPLRVIYEDDDLIVVNKGPGLLSSTVPGERRPTMAALVQEHVAGNKRARVGIIHRLDRDAAGILVFSKNQAAFDSLKAQFFHHTVSRQYRAIIHGKIDPPEGSITSRLVEYADGTVHSTTRGDKGQIARTDYKTLGSAKGRTLLLLTLQTGRKHQIRVQLNDRGNAIVGDRVYGPQPPVVGPMRLAAVKLELDHPRTGKRMVFEIEPPKYLGL